MNKIFQGLKRKRSGFYFALLTLFITLISFISYMGAANDSYGYDGIVIVLYLAAILVTVVFMIKDFGDIGAFLTGILYAAIFGIFIKVRFVYFATGLFGISQDGINPSMVLALLLLLPAGMINAIGAFFKREKLE